ncbi:dihydropyrimidinase [Heliomicrobium modesticaldum Ice1]|uniref:Dihydropyrimidinase n=1 Tax=Heliobacterium modesticaldum (strain ATCC 51547 / Ice1) TaxID=498761 RepID=B0TBF8_HELMI|nr:dihydropyrimidinase [Heliomicrobium modesticaldum]ABZ85171.1 dihydropyrimidinase [Heliomicrobium modesticaldum Ice1]
MGTLLRGGMIVTATESRRADLRIEGEQIAAIGENLERQLGDRVIDVTGALLFPGGVDAHTHFDLPVGDFATADDFASGSLAALFGGTTTIIDFATQFRGETLMTALENWHERTRGKCLCDYGFHMAITDWREKTPDEMAILVREKGVSSFKLYMAYKQFLQVDDGILFQALRRAREIGALVGLHCENGDVIDVLVREFRQQGKKAPWFHPRSRPPAVETEAVNRAIALARMVEAPLYIVHLSARQSLEAAEAARRQGLTVYVETCPQYLLLDESRYGSDGNCSGSGGNGSSSGGNRSNIDGNHSGRDGCCSVSRSIDGSDPFEGAKYVISPPLRSKEHKEALWSGLARGAIDTVATDHCAFFYRGQKDKGRDDFSRIPNGMPGVEHRLGLLYTYGVATGRISLNQFVSLTATRPAQLFGIFPRKGTIAVGADADIVVWDPATGMEITNDNHHYRLDYNPYAGFRQIGRPAHVFLRGRLIVRHGVLIDTTPGGRYLFRESSRILY